MVYFKVVIRPNDPISADTQTSRQTNNMALFCTITSNSQDSHHQTCQILQGRLAIHQIFIQMLASSFILSTTEWLPLAEKNHEATNAI